MSESDDALRTFSSASPGRLLREAREKQGLHIAALAASIKVSPKKLELLEADRFDALPDATFVRALAQTVCRALKIDPAPVLALLPPPSGHRLEQVGTGLNTPFRERPGALVQREGLTISFGPWFWITGLVVLAAIGVFFAPPGLLRTPAWASKSPVVAAASEPATVVTSESSILPGESVPASGPASAAAAVVPTASAPVVALAAPASAPAVVPTNDATVAQPATSDVPTGVLQVRAQEETWIEVVDARGHALVSRLVRPGETLGIDGEAPFRLRIGNAGGTRVSFRGQPMELAAYTRDNVARFELK